MKGCKKDYFALKATPKDKLRFWSKVQKTNTCWLFPTAPSSAYGRFKVKGVWIGAHRCAKLWRSRNKERANLLWACHLCITKNCVRPSHIYWGTPKQNYGDMIRDGTLSLEHLRGSNKVDSKLTETIVLQIYTDIAAGGHSLAALAQKYRISESVISGIANRRTWKHVLSDVPHHGLTRRERGNGFYSVLSENQVRQIKRLLLQKKTHSTISRIYGCSKPAISAISSGTNWAHVKVDEREYDALRQIGQKSTPNERKLIENPEIYI